VKSKILGAVGVILGFLVLAPAALANHITSASLTCTALTLEYNSFQGETVTVVWSTGTTSSFTLNGSGEKTVAPPEVNGMLTATVTWPAGSLTATAAGTCNTVPPPPTPPSPPTPPTPPSPPTTPTPPSPPTTPTPPSPPTTPTPPSQPTPPQGGITPIQKPKPGQRCQRLTISEVHVAIGPQRLIVGDATYTASAPSFVKSITVAIYGVGSEGVQWSHTYRGDKLVLHLDVTKESYWGDNPRVHSTYGVHRVKTTFRTTCSERAVSVDYDNQDPPR
jgi:hypothetical protein